MRQCSRASPEGVSTLLLGFVFVKKRSVSWARPPFVRRHRGRLFFDFTHFGLGVTTLRRRLSSSRMSGCGLTAGRRGEQKPVGANRMVGSSEQLFDNHACYV